MREFFSAKGLRRAVKPFLGLGE